MNGNPFAGASYVLTGLRLIFQPGIRPYVAIPLAINTLLFATLIWYVSGEFGAFIDRLLPGWLDWLSWLLWPLFAITTLVILFYTFTLVANLVGAPFNSLLAEAVERHLKGEPTGSQGGWVQALKSIGPALWAELKKLGYFALWAVPLLILFLIPVINLAAPFLWLAFSAWMLSLEYADYPMGNHGLLFPQQRAKLRERRLTALGFGGATLVLTAIPVVNFLVMPAATAGATVMWLKEWGKN